MSDEFQSGVCSGNWWNSPRNGLHASGSVPCSTSISEIGSFTGWSSEVVDMRVRSCEESVSVSDSSMVFQDNQKPQGSDSVSGGGGGGGGSGGSNNNNNSSNSILMDSTLQMMGYGLSTPTMDWNQGLLNRNTGGRADGNFHSMIQEELSSRPNYIQENFSGNTGDSSVAFSNRLTLGNSSETSQGLPSSFSMDSPVQYGFQTPYLQGLFESDLAPQPSAYENRIMNTYSSQPSYAMPNNDQLQHSWQKLPKQQINTNQLHFSNNTPFWNPSASATIRPNVLPPVQNQIFAQTFEDKSNSSNYTLKPKVNEVRVSGLAMKKPSNEPPLKRPRVETPSPLPTFKVRKEKLGDRVTALQQLVSPFGKTDTASVLFEAIEYIKFLHEQVSVLSAPYMKNGAPSQHQQGNDKSKDGEGPQQDLRSRGLCLVPMQSIFPVTNETTADFWTPTFGGTYR